MLKIAIKTQQMIFESEVLPSLFHSTPDKFFHYLERDEINSCTSIATKPVKKSTLPCIIEPLD